MRNTLPRKEDVKDTMVPLFHAMIHQNTRSSNLDVASTFDKVCDVLFRNGVLGEIRISKDNTMRSFYARAEHAAAGTEIIQAIIQMQVAKVRAS